MAILEQSSAIVKIDNASNTPVDISAQVKDISIGYQTNKGEYYALNVDFAYGIVGKGKYVGTLTVYHTGVANEAQDLLIAWATAAAATRRAARTLTVDVPDSLAGSRRVTGEFKLGGLGDIVKVDAASNEPGTSSVDLMCEGALTISTIGP